MNKPSLTPEQIRIFKAIHTKRTKGQLPEHEEEWYLQATLALADQRPLDIGTPEDLLEPVPAEDPPELPAFIPVHTPTIEPKTVEMVKNDVEAAKEVELDEATVHDMYLDVLLDMAREQGVYDEIQAARKTYGEIYINAVDNRVFAYRPMRFKDMRMIQKDRQPIENHREVVEACVVAGKRNVLTDDPKLFVFSTIYDFIDEVSGSKADVPYVVSIKDR